MQNDIEEEKRRNTQEILPKFADLSWEQLEGSYSNLECGLPCMEANSTVNLVPFGEDIKELRMCENLDFVPPVNILAPFACAPFSWAA